MSIKTTDRIERGMKNYSTVPTSVSKYIGKFDLFSCIFSKPVPKLPVENLVQVCSRHRSISAVAAEFLSKSKSSPLQLNVLSCLQVIYMSKESKKLPLCKTSLPYLRYPYGDRHSTLF